MKSGTAPVERTHFSDDEVKEIIRRAVHSDSSDLAASGEGLSFAELRAIGAEVGVRSADLEQAAVSVLRERRPVSGGLSGVLLGGPRLIHVERSALGAVAPKDLPELLATIRRRLGRLGHAAEFGESIEWTSETETLEHYVTLSTVDDHTNVRASANLSNLAAITFGPVGLMGLFSAIMGFVVAANAAHEVGMVLFALAIPGVYLALRTIYGRFAAAEARKLSRVVDELVQFVHETEDEAPKD